jgi:hypothetical protein
MKKGLLFLLLVAMGCREKSGTAESCAKPADGPGQKQFEMYEMSEMSMLMEQMYADNLRLKDRIVNGGNVGKFPSHFLNIHKAVMTDEKENDAFFKEQARIFIEAQQKIYEDPVNAKQHFNDGISACVRCHEAKCGGPIPRIKKLYIKQ